MTQEISPEVAEKYGFKGYYYPGEGWQGKNGNIQCLLPHGYFYKDWERIPGEIKTIKQLEGVLLIYSSYLNIKTMQPGPGQETTTVETTETTTVEKPTETTTTTTTTESPSE